MERDFLRNFLSEGYFVLSTFARRTTYIHSFVMRHDAINCNLIYKLELSVLMETYD